MSTPWHNQVVPGTVLEPTVEEETTEEEDEAALGQGGEEQMEVKVGTLTCFRVLGLYVGGDRARLTDESHTNDSHTDRPTEQSTTSSWGRAPSSACRRWRPRWWSTSAPSSSTTSACPSTTRSVPFRPSPCPRPWAVCVPCLLGDGPAASCRTAIAHQLNPQPLKCTAVQGVGAGAAVGVARLLGGRGDRDARGPRRDQHPAGTYIDRYMHEDAWRGGMGGIGRSIVEAGGPVH